MAKPLFVLKIRQADSVPVAVGFTRTDVTVREAIEKAGLNINKAEKASDSNGRSLSLDTIVTPEMGQIYISGSPKSGNII